MAGSVVQHHLSLGYKSRSSDCVTVNQRYARLLDADRGVIHRAAVNTLVEPRDEGEFNVCVGADEQPGVENLWHGEFLCCDETVKGNVVKPAKLRGREASDRCRGSAQRRRTALSGRASRSRRRC